MDHLYTQQVHCKLKQHANEDNAFQMKKYMREKFDFFGIKATPRRQLIRELIKEFGQPAEDEFTEIIKELWDLPERECQYAALDLIDRKKVFKERDIDLLQFLIVNKPWWDTVDWIASKHAGAFFQQYPLHLLEITGRWNQSDNLWLKRDSILFQLKYKDVTDEELLYSYIKQCLGSNE